MMKIKFGTTTFINSVQTTIIWFFPREKNTKKKLILLGFFDQSKHALQLL
jgi:hypothetical protein